MKSAFVKLTRKDLATFDRGSTDLILDAMTAGCTGRISSRGHAILHNAADGTASVPRNLTAPNRASQNARSDMRRFMAEHTQHYVSTNDAGLTQHRKPTTRHITVSKALVEYGAVFTKWMDKLPHGLPAQAIVSVTCGNPDTAAFAVHAIPETPPAPPAPKIASATPVERSPGESQLVARLTKQVTGLTEQNTALTRRATAAEALIESLRRLLAH